MNYKIKNEYLSAEVKSMGAELTSVKDNAANFEYLWQSYPEIWYGQAPVLFPVIGKLLEDKFRYNGKEYEMPKHGFARKTEFELFEQSESSVSLILRDSDTTFAIYPFRFDLIISFELFGRKLISTQKVINRDDKDIFFSMGAHPGFNCEIGDILSFDLPETLKTGCIDSDSILLNETFPLLNNETDIVITPDLFSHDALILNNIKSDYITLKRSDAKYSIKFYIGGAPYLGIWAKPNAPYVCIEPWCGVNDSYDKKNDISEKAGIVKLSAGSEFDLVWSADIQKNPS